MIYIGSRESHKYMRNITISAQAKTCLELCDDRARIVDRLCVTVASF
jgi:hypothetical protein